MDPFLSLCSEANANPASYILLVRQESQGDRQVAGGTVQEQRRCGNCHLYNQCVASSWTDDETRQVHWTTAVFENTVSQVGFRLDRKEVQQDVKVRRRKGVGVQGYGLKALSLKDRRPIRHTPLNEGQRRALRCIELLVRKILKFVPNEVGRSKITEMPSPTHQCRSRKR